MEPSWDFTATSANISPRAQEFFKEAAQANQTEIALAKVAEGKSQISKVKELAQTLGREHQKNYEQLQAIARAHGVVLDTALEAINQQQVALLQQADAADFDKEYAKLMLKDHVKCIKNYHEATSEIEEPDLKQYAQNTLPALRIHLLRSEDAARSAGVDESTIFSILKDLPSEAPVVSSR
jgi:putative membrane protein